MAQKNISLNEALDQAVERLPFWRRKTAQWKLRNREFRQGVLLELATTLSEEPKVQAMNLPMLANMQGPPQHAATAAPTAPNPNQPQPAPAGAVMDDNDLDAAFAAPIGIDVDKLAQILDLILKYLPAILDLITKLFAK